MIVLRSTLRIVQGQVADLERQLEHAHEEKMRVLDMYDNLLSQTLTLKRVGFEYPEQQAELEEAQSLPDTVMEAIEHVSDAGTPDYRHLIREAWAMVRGGTEESEIVERISRGEEIDF